MPRTVQMRYDSTQTAAVRTSHDSCTLPLLHVSRLSFGRAVHRREMAAPLSESVRLVDRAALVASLLVVIAVHVDSGKHACSR
jgi:hypothetical protein